MSGQWVACTCFYGHHEVIKLLVNSGADVHAKDDCALREATKNGENGHTEVVRLLLDYGANVHARDEDSYHGHLGVVKLLLRYGANAHAGDEWSLCHASKKGHTKIVKLLIHGCKFGVAF